MAQEAEEKRLAEEEAARIAAEEAAKTPEALAAKYGAMDLEERAFTILCVRVYVVICPILLVNSSLTYVSLL